MRRAYIRLPRQAFHLLRLPHSPSPEEEESLAIGSSGLMILPRRGGRGARPAKRRYFSDGVNIFHFSDATTDYLWITVEAAGFAISTIFSD